MKAIGPPSGAPFAVCPCGDPDPMAHPINGKPRKQLKTPGTRAVMIQAAIAWRARIATGLRLDFEERGDVVHVVLREDGATRDAYREAVVHAGLIAGNRR